MRQSRMMSFVEAVATEAVGYGVAVATQLIVRPTFGIAVTLGWTLAVGGVLTCCRRRGAIRCAGSWRASPIGRR